MQSAWNGAKYRHWSPESEAYAPGEVLLQYLQDTWTLDNPVRIEAFPRSGCRYVEIYHFVLVRGEERISIPLISNPVVLRLIQEYRLTVQRYDHETNMPSIDYPLSLPFGPPPAPLKLTSLD